MRRKLFMDPRITREVERQQKVQDDAYAAVFKSGQLCWWYIMYAPEYSSNWDEDRMKKFTDDVLQNISEIDQRKNQDVQEKA